MDRRALAARRITEAIFLESQENVALSPDRFSDHS
jgi:hypothetical protein